MGSRDERFKVNGRKIGRERDIVSCDCFHCCLAARVASFLFSFLAAIFDLAESRIDRCHAKENQRERERESVLEGAILFRGRFSIVPASFAKNLDGYIA